MNKQSIQVTLTNFKVSLEKHQPEILTGIGIAGMISTTIMAVRSTPKALDLLSEIKEEHEQDDDKKEMAKDIVIKIAPLYLPSIVIGAVSISCIIGASSINFKRNAALATAYSLSETALKDYRNKVIETMGDKKDQTIIDHVAKDKIEKNPVIKQQIILTEKGSTLCYDNLSGRYFKSDIDILKKAENEINKMLLVDDAVSLNDFYDLIGLDDIGVGELIGWRMSDGFIELDFSSQLTADGEPCIVMMFNANPIYDYNLYS